MTRREEIELAWLNKAVQSNHRYDEKTFKEAVEWADKTMIEKASEWLKEQDMDKYLRLSAGIICVTTFDKELFIKDFLKAMEE